MSIGVMAIAESPSLHRSSTFARDSISLSTSLETKITISPGLNTPAAMFHDFENAQKSFWDWTKH